MTGKDASTLTTVSASRHSLLWLGVLVGVGFYIVDVLVDTVLFSEGSLREQLLHPSASELWVQTCVLLLAGALGMYAQFLLGRERATSECAKTTEMFLNSIVDNNPDRVFIKGAEELRFLRVNHTGERLLGLTARELIGRNDYDFFPEPQAEFFIRKDREVPGTGIEIDIPEAEIDTATLMGMGLSISRSIIEAHDGKLWADEQRPKGALFCISLPGCE